MSSCDNRSFQLNCHLLKKQIIEIGPVFAILAVADANNDDNDNGDYDPKVILS